MPEIAHVHVDTQHLASSFAPPGYSFVRDAPVHMNQALPWQLRFRFNGHGFFVIFVDPFGDDQFTVYVDAPTS